MSDLQPSRFPPSPDVSHAQTTQWSADEQSDEESSPKEWGDEDFGVGKQRFILWWQWRDARFEGTLPLALSARIPLEIFEFVIDAIEDQSTLPVVALVCAMWYPRAMHNLYYAVEIRSRTSFNRLYKQCYASPRVKQWLANTCQLRAYGSTRYMGFLQALPSALAGLMPRVRLLDIRFGRLSFIHTGFFFALSDFNCGGLCLPSPSLQTSRL
ncbi:uncharacterized protein B0H18DRAFT_571754 [Fomitopsis serialis]|uniref:uncharacterized protein n=1 Tax=Fomitopsis serialis TaxID=139415 RepID=UPI0020084501|nr:uncharacterized protein B0H18DRAFT_571754 [Neoantrodia serialis]KAH9921165.1 hypothetical protein B0H18DRAFT_571754 [Neoantrodia serialis]